MFLLLKKSAAFVISSAFQPDLTGICTYFTRWLICTTSLLQIHMIFAKSYAFYELPIRMNMNEWPTPKPPCHWGLEKSY